ncbi:hypothetical protein [Falsirhodobacter algicola]|uniref:Excinuclease ABC subunit B n=1 Tax=Falsirhodobacter algicola TaxID=2692330 RepID=A0A8J8SJW9_9RHOB|nr:hypothetical protein [Falsirhodobacter algicola]QUS34843.1 hypothetical protein GR316_00305 [Falsirhodobacter algicola]
MKTFAALPLLALLAACATPHDRCVSTVTRDLRTVDALIAGSERTLARGYGVEEYQVSRPVWRQCGRYPDRIRDGRRIAGAPRMCWRDEVETRTRPVAVNLTDEAETLASLRAKRAQLAAEAKAGIAQCDASFPET